MKIKPLLLENISPKQTVFKNTFWLGIAEVVSKAPIFLLGVLVVRYLGAENYGRFSFAFAFAFLFSFLTDLGFSPLTVREVAKNKNLAGKYVGNFLALKLILSLATLIFTLLATQFWAGYSLDKTLICLVAVFTILISFAGFLQSILQAFEKMEYLALLKIIYSICLSLAILTVIWKNLGIEMLVGGYLFSAAITLIATLIIIGKKFTKFRLQFDFDFWRKVFRKAWPFGVIGLLGSAYSQVSILQIGFISSQTQVGFYSAAYQFIFILTTLANLLLTSLFPSLSKQYRQSKSHFYQTVNFFALRIIIFSLLFNVLLFITGKELILLLYGADYWQSVSILYALLISSFILLFSATFSLALRVANLQKQYLKFLSAGIILNFTINFPLIYIWQGFGASLATILSSLTITLLVVRRFRKLKRVDLKVSP